MSENGSASGGESKRRGTGFPSMSLQEAVDAVVTAGQNGPDHSQDAFATYLGHKTANSGAFRGKLASLRDWGLIARGDRDRITLSELAQNLVMAVPEHYEAKQLLLAAFESCRAFGMLHNDSAKNVPIDISRLRNQVLMRYGVTSDQVDRFVDAFVKSAVFTGIAESDGAKITLLLRDTVFSGGEWDNDAEDHEPAVTAVVNTPDVVRGSPPVALPVAIEPPILVALRQAWPIDNGVIEFIIRTPDALPPSIYIQVAQMAEVATEMQKKLKGPCTEIITDSPPVANRTDSALKPTDD